MVETCAIFVKLFLEWSFQLTGNYGISIIFLAVVLNLMIFPLLKKARIQTQKLGEIQGDIKKIKEKYFGRDQEIKLKIRDLMLKNRVNPLMAFLPILFQMPVYLGLYHLVDTNKFFDKISFYGWIQDLSAADPIFFLPIMLGFSWWLNGKLAKRSVPKSNEEQGEEGKTDFMGKWGTLLPPVLGALLMTSLPSAMTLYYLTQAVSQLGFSLYWNTKL